MQKCERCFGQKRVQASVCACLSSRYRIRAQWSRSRSARRRSCAASRVASLAQLPPSTQRGGSAERRSQGPSGFVPVYLWSWIHEAHEPRCSQKCEAFITARELMPRGVKHSPKSRAPCPIVSNIHQHNGIRAQKCETLVKIEGPVPKDVKHCSTSVVGCPKVHNT